MLRQGSAIVTKPLVRRRTRVDTACSSWCVQQGHAACAYQSLNTTRPSAPHGGGGGWLQTAEMETASPRQRGVSITDKISTRCGETSKSASCTTAASELAEAPSEGSEQAHSTQQPPVPPQWQSPASCSLAILKLGRFTKIAVRIRAANWCVLLTKTSPSRDGLG